MPRSPHARLTRAAAMIAAVAMLVVPCRTRAQSSMPTHTPGMVHTPGMSPDASSPLPTQGGQAAFAAIAEIVRLLNADTRTDWSRVNLERLRLHLVDMDLVTLRSTVTTSAIPGGALFTVRGTGETIAAIQRMTRAHVAMVDAASGPRIVRAELPNGVTLRVTARDSTDARAVAKLRGLGFIGLMADGDHHTAHHLMLAQGASMPEHGH